LLDDVFNLLPMPKQEVGVGKQGLVVIVDHPLEGVLPI